jgi:hypothetical protein
LAIGVALPEQFEVSVAVDLQMAFLVLIVVELPLDSLILFRIVLSKAIHIGEWVPYFFVLAPWVCCKSYLGNYCYTAPHLDIALQLENFVFCCNNKNDAQDIEYNWIYGNNYWYNNVY